MLRFLATPTLILICAGYPVAPEQSTSAAALEARLRQQLRAGVGSYIKTVSIESLGDAERAATEFAQYIQARTGYRFPGDFVQRLADAEWRARSAGSGSVPISQFSETATRLFLAELTRDAAPVPAGLTSAPYYVVTAEKLNTARLFYARNLPELIPSQLDGLSAGLSSLEPDTPALQHAYPIEAFLAIYVCISEDLGRAETDLRQEVYDRTTESGAAFISARRKPYGDFGFFVRRPLSRLFSAANLDRLLATVP